MVVVRLVQRRCDLLTLCAKFILTTFGFSFPKKRKSPVFTLVLTLGKKRLFEQ